MTKKIVILSLLLMNILVFSGCWNYKDIEDVAIVTGVAIDKNKQNNNYALTIEIANQQVKAKESKLSSLIIESEGYTVFDAIRNASIHFGKKLFWSHCKVVIVNQDVAREGILPVLDFFVRDAETRSDIWVLIAASATAKEILKTPVESNQITSLYLNDLLQSEKNTSKYVAAEMMLFAEKLSSGTISAIVPITKIVTNNDKTQSKISGSAVFKQDKLVYFLSDEESKLVLMLHDTLKGGLLTIHEANFDADMRITFEIFRNKTELKPIIQDNNLIMQINIKTDVAIGELGGSTDFAEKDKRKILQKDMQDLLEQRIKDLVLKTQQNNSTDIFDFSGTIQRKNPDYWKKIQPDWDEIYKNIEVQPNVAINIIRSGFAQKPVQLGE